MSRPTAPFVGIDFGTTNTAVAVADPAGGVQLLPLPHPGTAGAEAKTAPYWRTILYYEEDGKVSAGAQAIARYLDTGGEGRLVQSIKSHLASASFGHTFLFGKRRSLEDMVAAYLRQIRAAVPVDLGSRCVVGRPVHFWGADTKEDDDRALLRMTTALKTAGFTEVSFEYEPVAAAARYAATLRQDQLIVVADFGGGTTDFSVIHVGPGAPTGKSAILATGGIGISGDAFDARVIDALVSPALGKGTTYRDEMGAVTLIPPWLFHKLRRWHYLSFLKEESTVRLLARVHQGAMEKAKVARLVRLVEDDLGLPLHQAVEQTKVQLSSMDAARLDFRKALDLDLPCQKGEFEDWISPDLLAIGGVLDCVLAEAGVVPDQVDRVFATGGSSLVPAVRGVLADRFGEDKIVGGQELTSVAWGLAACAREAFLHVSV